MKKKIVKAAPKPAWGFRSGFAPRIWLLFEGSLNPRARGKRLSLIPYRIRN
jgi:hypothetical protein